MKSYLARVFKIKPQKAQPIEPSEFEIYRQALPKEDTEKVASFFAELDKQVAILPVNEKRQIRADFEKALLYYNSLDAPLDVALTRLGIENLGGFYIRPPILWYALDSAAKIYPLSMRHGQMSVFRLSVYLKQPVIPEILQMALTFTIKRFPTFATTVKKGVFWHYLDTAKRRYTVEKEVDIPCRPLKILHSRSQSFRVLYYRNRISIEYFHVLTDGSGGLVFLKTLTAEYLRLLGIEPSYDAEVLDINDVPPPAEAVNEFANTEKTANNSGFIDTPAMQMSGKMAKNSPCRILHFRIDSTALKAAAKAKNATITAYLLALMFVAGKYATDENEGNINIQVPVNMRKFYPSSTLRNFSMYCGIKLLLTDVADADSIVENISKQLSEKSSLPSMNEMLSSTERMVNAMRYIPLFIKAPVAKIGYGFLGERIFSNTLSNVGLVTMPPEMAEQIENIDVVLCGSPINRASCAAVSFDNTTTLSITKTTLDPSFEKKLFELLVADGVVLTVEGTELYED